MYLSQMVNSCNMLISFRPLGVLKEEQPSRQVPGNWRLVQETTCIAKTQILASG